MQLECACLRTQEDAAEEEVDEAGRREGEVVQRTEAALAASAHVDSSTTLPDTMHAEPLPSAFAAQSNSSGLRQAGPPSRAEKTRRNPAQRASVPIWLCKHLPAPGGGDKDTQERKLSSGASSSRSSSIFGQDGSVSVFSAAEAVKCATSVLTQSAGRSRYVGLQPVLAHMHEYYFSCPLVQSIL